MSGTALKRQSQQTQELNAEGNIKIPLIDKSTGSPIRHLNIQEHDVVVVLNPSTARKARGHPPAYREALIRIARTEAAKGGWNHAEIRYARIRSQKGLFSLSQPTQMC
jgi:hypothetical protein